MKAWYVWLLTTLGFVGDYVVGRVGIGYKLDGPTGFGLLATQAIFLCGAWLWRTYRVRIERKEASRGW